MIETSDFDLPRSEDKIQIRPEGDSVLCWFFPTPKREGIARLLVRVLEPTQEITLTKLRLTTLVVRDEVLLKANYQVVDTQLFEQRQYAAKLAEERAVSETRELFKLLHEAYKLLSSLRVLVLPQRELVAYLQQYLQTLISLLAEREVEGELLQEITTLRGTLESITITEFSGKRYDDAILEWSFRFKRVKYLLLRELGGERWRTLVKKLNAIAVETVRISDFRCHNCGLPILPPFLFLFRRWYYDWLECPSCGAGLERQYMMHVEDILERLEYMLGKFRTSEEVYEDVRTFHYELHELVRRWRTDAWWYDDHYPYRFYRLLEKLEDIQIQLEEKILEMI